MYKHGDRTPHWAAPKNFERLQKDSLFSYIQKMPISETEPGSLYSPTRSRSQFDERMGQEKKVGGRNKNNRREKVYT